MTDARTFSVSGQRRLVVSDNGCRNLLHFRGALLTALQEEGFTVVALAPADDKARELQERGVQLWPVRLTRASVNPLCDGLLLLRYVQLLWRIRPAFYCSFTIKPNVYGGFAARICGIPFIANVTGLGTTFLAKGPLWWIVEYLYRLAFGRARAVFFHNSDDLRTFVKRGIVSPGQAKVIPGSGVDLERFRPTGARLGRPVVFLFVGRLIRDKGIREFIDAARIVRQRDPAVRFQLLGSVDPGNRTSVTETELQSWLAEGLVEHLGEHEDIRPFVDSATAVVLPSYREGMSRALLEAAAMGKPLLGSDVAGVRELVEEGVTGASFAPRDVFSMAAAMQRIAEAPAEILTHYGANARRKVEANFGESVVVNAYLDLVR